MTVFISYAAPLKADRRRAAKVIILVGFGINLIAIALLVALNCRALWDISTGTPIRPMGLAAADLLGCGAVFMVSSLIALIAVCLGWRSRRIWFRGIGLFLSGFLPALSVLEIVDWIVAAHRLVVEG